MSLTSDTPLDLSGLPQDTPPYDRDVLEHFKYRRWGKSEYTILDFYEGRTVRYTRVELQVQQIKDFYLQHGVSKYALLKPTLLLQLAAEIGDITYLMRVDENLLRRLAKWLASKRYDVTNVLPLAGRQDDFTGTVSDQINESLIIHEKDVHARRSAFEANAGITHDIRNRGVHSPSLHDNTERDPKLVDWEYTHGKAGSSTGSGAEYSQARMLPSAHERRVYLDDDIDPLVQAMRVLGLDVGQPQSIRWSDGRNMVEAEMTRLVDEIERRDKELEVLKRDFARAGKERAVE